MRVRVRVTVRVTVTVTVTVRVRVSVSVSVRALLVPQHTQPEHELVEAEGVLERADLGDPVERAHI